MGFDAQDCISKFRTTMLSVAVVGALVASSAGQASAQGLFDFFLGNSQREPATRALSYAPAATDPTIQRQASQGTSLNYCVRLCDGRYFPLPRHASGNPAQLCNALCPSSKTKIFAGGDAPQTAAADGTRYSSLQNAFLYRKQLVADCTCNGKDHFGLAKIDPKDDPTSRSGDIVVAAGDRNAAAISQPGRAASRVSKGALPN